MENMTCGKDGPPTFHGAPVQDQFRPLREGLFLVGGAGKVNRGREVSALIHAR